MMNVLHCFYLLLLLLPGIRAAQLDDGPVLRYRFWWEATSFDTLKGDHFDVMQVARNIYAPLVSIGMDGKPQGMIAEDWRVSPDGKRWRFILRKGLLFEDGNPITPGTVLANFRRILWHTRTESLPLNSLLPEIAGWTDRRRQLESVRLEGDDLVFRFSKRPHDFLEIISHPTYSIASLKCFDAAGRWKDPFCSVASGQYKVVERRPGLIRLESRRVYPEAAGAPGKVELRTPLKEGKSPLEALLAGDIDLSIEPMFALSGQTLGLIKKAGLVLTEEPPSRMYFVQLNHTRPPFNDPELRRSIRNSFLRFLGHERDAIGLSAPDPSFMPRGSVGYSLLVSSGAGPVRKIKASAEVILFPLANYYSAADAVSQVSAEKAFLAALEEHGINAFVSRYPARKGAMEKFLKGSYGAIMRGSGIAISNPYSGLEMMFLSSISALIPDPSGRAAAGIKAAGASSDPAMKAEFVKKMNTAVFEDAAVLNFAHSSWVYIHRPEVDMSRFNLFMDPIEFRAVGLTPAAGGRRAR